MNDKMEHEMRYVDCTGEGTKIRTGRGKRVMNINTRAQEKKGRDVRLVKGPSRVVGTTEGKGRRSRGVCGVERVR